MDIEGKGVRLLTENQTAEYLNLSPSTLRQQRMRKRPKSSIPLVPYTRVGRIIHYDIVDLDTWIADQKLMSG